MCILGAISWIVGPIVRMQDAMRRLAEGNLETRVPSLGRKDEIGQMAGAVQVFHTNAVERSKLNRETRLLSELNEWLQSCKSLDELYQMVAEFLSSCCRIAAGQPVHLCDLEGHPGERQSLERRADDAGHAPRRLLGIAAGTYLYLWRERDRFPLRPRRRHRTAGLLLHPDPGAWRDHRTAPPRIQGRDRCGWWLLQGGRHDEQRRLGLVCAEQISLAIANVKLRDQLRDQSIRDALTGMFNRRYMMETCRREFSRAARAGQSVGILSIDVDHFKKFNDNHGHDAGDTVLRGDRRLPENSFRDEDVPCRFGGEEFVVALPGATAAVAAQKAEDLRARVEALVVRYLEGNLPKITICIGVAAFPDRATTRRPS